MKRISVLLVLLPAVLAAASFAFADDGGSKGKGKGTEKQQEKQSKCHNISLRGTAPATTFTVTVEKANKAGRDLKTATVSFSGKVRVNAQLCTGDSSATTTTLKLRNLKVAKASSEATGG